MRTSGISTEPQGKHASFSTGCKQSQATGLVTVSFQDTGTQPLPTLGENVPYTVPDLVTESIASSLQRTERSGLTTPGGVPQRPAGEWPATVPSLYLPNKDTGSSFTEIFIKSFVGMCCLTYSLHFLTWTDISVFLHEGYI